MKIQNGAGRFAAAVGLSAVVTAGFGWVEQLVGWSVAAMLRAVLPGGEKLKIRQKMASGVLAGGVLILAAVVMVAEAAFPEDGTFPFVSLGLFLLLYRTMVGEKETGRIVSNVLGLILLGLMGVILIFGLVDASWSRIVPEGFVWKRVLLIIGITAPWWCAGGEKENWGWFLGSAVVCTGMSIMVRSLLGSALTEYSAMPMYQAVQTIKILGTVQRFESLLAAAVLLGTYAQMSFVAEIMEEAAVCLLPGVKKEIWAAGILFASFLLENGYRCMELGVQDHISTVFWGLLPVFTLWIVICRKIRKNEKSS